MPKIPLIEIKNPILLQFASEADSKGNNNSLLDTDEEISIFQTKAKSTIKTGLCTQKDYDDVMKIDVKKIKTQVTTMEDLRNSRLKNNPVKTENNVIPLDLRKTITQIIALNDLRLKNKQNNKDYDEKYYNQMKEILKNQINKYEKELAKVKKDLEKAQNEFEKSKKDVKARLEYEQKTMDVANFIYFMVTALFVLGDIGVAMYAPELFLIPYGFMAEGGATHLFLDPERRMLNDPEYLKAKAKCDNLNDMIDKIQISLKDVKNNLDTIVRQKNFLENMGNYIKLLDQRESFLNMLKANNKNDTK